MAKKTIKFKGIEFEEVNFSEYSAGSLKTYCYIKIKGKMHYFLQKKTKKQVVKG